MAQQTPPNLTWLLNDLVSRVKEAEGGVVLSNDGLRLAEAVLTREDAEHLAALAAGLQSLAKGAGKQFDGGPPRQTIIELEKKFLFVTAAGSGACLAVLTSGAADIGHIAYEMTMLVERARTFLTAPPRQVPAGTP